MGRCRGPRAGLIYVYAQDVFDATLAAIDQNLAPVISMSYGTCEANLSSADVESIQGAAQQANAQGITWVTGSGDAGAAACDAGAFPATHGLSVEFPASLPEVTGVGGTEFNEGNGGYWSLSNNSAGESATGYIPEIAWNDSAQGTGLASGGGASALFGKPTWQVGPGVPANDARYVPDISFSASPYHDPYLVIGGGSLYGFGGTSASTPLFAGAVALLNQRLASSSLAQGVGNINPILYGGQTGAPATAAPWYHDIIAGDNLVPCVEGTPDCVNGLLGYSAGPGYDPVTGLGSLDVRTFVFGIRIPTTTTLTVPASVLVEGRVALTVTVNGAGGLGPSTNPATANQDLVTILQGDAIMANGDLSSGVATIPMPLQPGVWTFTAEFNGDSVLLPSESYPVTFLVTPDEPAPVLLTPGNQATEVPVSVQLEWNGARYATSYDVYFGIAPTPPFWGNTPSFSCVTSGLAPGTTYDWKIVANTSTGPIASPTWSFTTTLQPGYSISTLAGTGQSGYSGDGGPATRATLSSPERLALDAVGNVYVADAGNNRVRAITPAGIISTVAGSGSFANSGDGGPALAAGMAVGGIAVDALGNLYISSGQRDSQGGSERDHLYDRRG
ncbi:MAG: S8 family serine peptidase [Bryobacteraceae bacterium]|jgi:hypothetical protein